MGEELFGIHDGPQWLFAGQRIGDEVRHRIPVIVFQSLLQLLRRLIVRRKGRIIGLGKGGQRDNRQKKREANENEFVHFATLSCKAWCPEEDSNLHDFHR